VSEQVKWTAYYRLVGREAWKDARKNLVSTIIATVSAVLAAYLQYRYYLLPFSSNLPKLTSSFVASLIVLAGYFLFYVLRAPWAVYLHFQESMAAKQSEIDELKRQLETPSLSVEIVSAEIEPERISNYHSASFPNGYFGVRVYIWLRIANLGRVATAGTVTPHLEKNGVPITFYVSLHSSFGRPDLQDVLDLEAPIVFGVPREGQFALVLEGKREEEVKGGKLRIEVTDGLKAVSTAETTL
jgi:hypothetical protein